MIHDEEYDFLNDFNQQFKQSHAKILNHGDLKKLKESNDFLDFDVYDEVIDKTNEQIETILENINKVNIIDPVFNLYKDKSYALAGIEYPEYPNDIRSNKKIVKSCDTCIYYIKFVQETEKRSNSGVTVIKGACILATIDNINKKKNKTISKKDLTKYIKDKKFMTEVIVYTPSIAICDHYFPDGEVVKYAIDVIKKNFKYYNSKVLKLSEDLEHEDITI